MTTDEAFEALLNTRGIYKELGITRGAVGSFKTMLKDGKGISIDLKIKLLEKSGYNIKQEMIWEKPNI